MRCAVNKNVGGCNNMKITRRLPIAILSLLMIFAVSMAVACNKKDSSSSSSGGNTEITAVNGKFYCEIAGDENMVVNLELKDDNTYVIKVNGKKEEGTYELDQSSLKLKVGADVKYEASYNNDNVVLTISGKPYTLLVDIDFTVTFVGVDQSVFGDYGTIKNGKKLDLPTPEKDGCRFVAWYTDQTYSKLFNLNTAITGNIKLYARFVTVGQEEYVVRFHDGDALPTEVQTSGKQLASLPTNENEDFVGWWISETSDASELTRQLESGVDLYEDIDVYAVYGKDGLHVSVSSDGKITWNELANHANTTYTVEINGKVETLKKGISSYTGYDFGAQPAGKYTVKVSANGMVGTAVYTNKRLLKPSMLKAEGFEFSFGAVENATSYTLRVTGPGYSLDVELGSTTAYNFADLETGADGITFTVTAKADGYVSSTNSLNVNYKLDSVENVIYDKENRQVKWDAVQFASEYLLTITAGGKAEEHTVEGTSYDVSHLYGSFTVSVTPVAKGYNSPEATVAELSKEDLASPTGMLYTSDGTKDYLTWNEVTGATGYTLKVVCIEAGGKESSNVKTEEIAAGKTTKYELANSLFVYAGDNAEYIEFRLTAKAADAKNNSAVAKYRIRNSASGVAALAEADFAYNEGVLSWMPVRRVSQYKVVLPDGTTKTAADTSAEITFAKAGKNTISLEYNDRYGKATTASYSVEAYAVVFQTGGSAVATQYKAAGDIVVLPAGEKAPVKVGYDFAAWYNGEDTTSAVQYGSSFKLEQAATAYVYAGWTPKEYNVTLATGEYGEELPAEKSTVTVAYKQTDAMFPVPAVGGDKSKLFLGWYSEPNGQGQRFANQYGVMTKGYNMPYDSTMYAYYVTAFEFETNLVDSKTGEVKTYSVKKGPEIGLFKNETVTIPAYYNGKRVDLIETFAFSDCDFRVIEIPSTVKTIELITGGLGSAFSECDELEAINVYHAEGALAGETRYFSDDGVLYFNNEDYVEDPATCEKTELAYVPMAKTGTVYIPEGVEIIPMGTLGSYDGGETSYKASHDFDKVVIPYTVTTIQEQAFVSNSKLTEITFLDAPDGTVAADLTIGASAMASCTKLTTINFPARLKTFDAAILEGCTKITAINFSAGSADYLSKDGVVFSANMKKLIYFPCGRAATDENPELGKYTIPEKVEIIGSNAFSGALITEVTIGKDVTTIEPYAFSGVSDKDGKSLSGISGYFKGKYCSKLEKINFVDGDLPLSIGEGAFSGSAGELTEVTFPRNLTYLGKFAFMGRTKIKTVNIDLDPYYAAGTEIKYEESAFAWSTANLTPSVEVVNLGDKVPVIETLSGLFGGSKLKEINVGNNPNYSIGYVPGTQTQQALYNNDITKILYFFDAVEDDYVLPETITEIPAGTFRAKDGLTGITLHSGVKYIGDEAFRNCGSLARVTILDGTGENITELELGNNVFQGCDELVEVTLPTRMRKAGSGLFKGCKLLENVVIPEGVTELGDEAFSASSDFSKNYLKTVSLPSTLEKFGTYKTVNDIETLVSLNAFMGCDYLEEIRVAEGNTKFFTNDGILYNKVYDDNFKTEVQQLIVCPAGKVGTANVIANVTKVWANAFKNNTETTEVVFAPSTMENYSLEIGENAFAGCKKLTKISLPEGLKEIPLYTFKDCSSLEEVVIPSTVEKIHAYGKVNGFSAYGAFYNCAKLKTVTFAPTPAGQTPVSLEIADGYLYGDNYGNTYVYSAFTNCPSLTEITFPERTIKIGDATFAHNKTIKKVTLPSTLQTLGEKVFYTAKGLEEVVFEEGENGSSLKDIPAYAFAFSGLKKLTLPEGLENLYYQAFGYCSELTSVTIPSTVKVLGVSIGTYSVGYTFYGCTKLATVTFAENTQLEEILNCSFQKTAITEVTIPATVKVIAKSAFADLKIDTVEFLTETDGDGNKASALTNIGESAFANSTIRTITLPETKETLALGKSLFSGCTNLEEVHLSSKVASISNVFDGCKSDYTITVSKDNKNLQVHDTLPLIISEQQVEEEGVTKTVISIKFAYKQIKQPELNIPDNCVSIEINAFALQQYITKVVIPSGVTTIGDGAFHDCRVLKEVVFEYDENGQNQLAALGANNNSYGVFQNCYSLTKIVLPDNKLNVTTAYPNGVIHDKTFYGCVSLEKLGVTPADIKDIANLGNGVYIPSSLTAIGTKTKQNYSGTAVYGAFQKCLALESVTLPAGIQQLNDLTFSECSSLTKIAYVGAPENEDGTVDNALPNTLQVIGTYMFYRNASLSSLTLPTNTKYTALKHSMFRESGITSITIPANVNTIGNDKSASNVFQDCKNLETVTIANPAKLTTVGALAFAGCVKLKTIDISGAKNLGSKVFQNCTALESVKLCSSATELGTYMFENCTSLTGVAMKEDGTPDFDENGNYKYNFELPSSLVYLASSAFTGSGLIAIRIPAKVLALTSSVSNAKTIKATNYNTASSAFKGCADLERVEFLGNAVLIGKSAFENCTSLSEIVAPDADQNNELTVDGFFKNIKYVGDCAFKNTGVKKLVLNSLEATGKEVFMESAVEEVSIAQGMRYLNASKKELSGWGASMFKNCANLKGVKVDENGEPVIGPETNDYIYTVSLPDDYYFGSSTFEGSGLIAFRFQEAITTIGSDGTNSAKYTGTTSLFKNCVDLKKVVFENAKIKQISGSVFMGCTSLATVEGIGNVAYIGSNAFNGTAIKSLEFNENVTFGTSAFESCKQLESVTFSDKQTEIGSSAFIYCSKLAKVNASNTHNVNFPDSITTLGLNAFCQTAISGTVNLPAKLKTINNGAFFNCNIEAFEISSEAANFAVKDGVLFNKDMNKLVSVPKNKQGKLDLSTVTEIGSYSLSYCEGITQIVMPSALETINDYAFAYFTFPENFKIKLPEGLTELGRGVFQNATNVGEIVIPDTVTEIGNGIFKGSDVTKVTLSDALIEVPTEAFMGCTELTEVKFGTKLEEIGTNAFNGSGLTSVTIPGSVYEFGTAAFANCESLEKVVLEEGISYLGAISAGSRYIPSKDTKIYLSSSKEIFKGSAVKNVTFPSTLLEITNYAFTDTKIETLDLSNTSVEKIGTYAFQNAPLTGKLVLPETLTTIGKYAFAGKERTPVLDESGNETGEYDYTGCASLTEVVLPAGYVNLDEGTFANQYSLAKINLENVQKIYEFSLVYAGILNETGLELTFSSLTYVGKTIHKIDTTIGSETFAQVTSYGNGALQGANIKKITFTNVDTVKGNLFHSFTKLPEIVFPEGLTALPDYFYAYSLIEEVTVPANIEKLGSGVFELCVNLKKITFEEGSKLKEVGMYAFSQCVKLETLVLPETIETAGSQLFKYDISLKKLIIPESMVFGATDNMSFTGWGADQTVYFKIAEDVRYRVLAYNFADNSKANFVFGYTGN